MATKSPELVQKETELLEKLKPAFIASMKERVAVVNASKEVREKWIRENYDPPLKK